MHSVFEEGCSVWCFMRIPTAILKSSADRLQGKSQGKPERQQQLGVRVRKGWAKGGAGCKQRQTGSSPLQKCFVQLAPSSSTSTDAEEECSLSWQALGALPRVWGGHRLLGCFLVPFPLTPQLVDIHHPKALILCGSRLEMGRGTRLTLAFLF